MIQPIYNRAGNLQRKMEVVLRYITELKQYYGWVFTADPWFADRLLEAKNIYTDLEQAFRKEIEGIVVVDEVVAADFKQDLTITVYDANGKAVASAVESVASYLARQIDKGNAPVIYDAVAKYCAAAYAYLHK